MSRTGRTPRSRSLDRPVVHVLIAGWHAPCFLLLTGCPYLVPFEYAPEDRPPEVISMSPGNDEPILLDSDVTVLLFVQDPEAEAVTFLWSISGLGWQGNAVPVTTGSEAEGLYASQLSLAEDPALDGRTLFCDYWDGESEHQQVAWDLQGVE